MRSPLVYLALTRMKNRLRSLVRSPGKLIYLILILAMVGLTVFGGNVAPVDSSQLRDIRELYAGVLALYAGLFLLIANNGFGEGASLFSLADVSFVFPAPIRPQRVLFFGLFQQLGSSLLLGIFLLFQYSWMHRLYGVGYGVILLILLGYSLNIFLAQLTAMTIYMITSADERLRGRVKAVCAGALSLCGAGLLYSLWSGGAQPVALLVEAGNSIFARLFPVAGWTADMTAGLIAGEPAAVFRGLILCAAYVTALVLLITRSRQDYYEDVLKASETAYLAVAAKKEGRVGETRRKVRVGSRGFARGEGANAFYYKHRIENRRARLFMLGSLQLLFAGCIILFSVFVRGLGVVSVFAFATYMQIFTVALGRLPKELMKPYVYLVPEPPFRKLLQCIRESFPGFVLEAVLVFVPVGLILGLPVPETLCCILARISFSLLFLGGNIVVGRVFGMVTSKVFAMLFYIVTMILLALPGAAAAILLSTFGMMIVSPAVTVFLALAVCNIPVALLAVYLCRDMLLYAELH